MCVLKNVYRRYKKQSPYAIFVRAPIFQMKFSFERLNKHTCMENSAQMPQKPIF